METREHDSSPAPVDILHTWWSDLNDHRGDRAEMRRCRSVDDVLLTEAYHKLRGRFRRAELLFGEEQLAATSGLLAHVRGDIEDGPTFAEHMGQPKSEGSDRARVSGLRFRRLLRHESREALYRPLIRIIRLLDRRLNVSELATDLYYWSPDKHKEWARHYYETAPAEP